MLKYRGDEPMNRQNHYFFAIELPSEVKEWLSHWADELRRIYSYKSWVHPSDYHITLAFLGSASPEILENAVQHVQTEVKHHTSFPLSITGLGTFGVEKRPRILWADMRKQLSLYEMQKDVWHACSRIGFKLDTKPFHPHITIARRCLEDMDRESFGQVENSLPVLPEFMVQHLVLYQTNSHSVPKYEPIVRFPLT